MGDMAKVTDHGKKVAAFIALYVFPSFYEKNWGSKIGILDKRSELGAQNCRNTKGFKHVVFDFFYIYNHCFSLCAS